MASGRRVAVACQGGGSHAAFTAGVLQTLLLPAGRPPYQLMAFTGTSGGAVSALLAWYGVITGNAETAIDLLDGFWRENAAQLSVERLLNLWAVSSARWPVDVRASPYVPPWSTTVEQLQLWAQLHDRFRLWGPRRAFVDLRTLLERYVRFGAVQGHVGEPWLLVGAVEVRSGRFKAFDSRRREITVEAILASAAIPWLVQAVDIGGQRYWDGLFSQNPPIRDLVSGRALDEIPDEIWVIQLDPQERQAEPTSAEAILDRRTELAGNLSLNQEIAFIESVNRWLREGVVSANRFKPIEVRRIAMSAALAARLDTASKRDRSPALISELLADGRAQAQRFLARRAATRDAASR